MRVLINNKTDLIFLILTKILFAYSIYLFSSNFFMTDFFAYPDMKAYKDCFGEGDIMVNLLYSQFLCSLDYFEFLRICNLICNLDQKEFLLFLF